MGITVGVDKLVTRHFFFSLSLLFILLLFPLVSGTRTVGRVFFKFYQHRHFYGSKHNNLKDVEYNRTTRCTEEIEYQ